MPHALKDVERDAATLLYILNVISYKTEEISEGDTLRLRDGRAEHVLRTLKPVCGDSLRLSELDVGLRSSTVLELDSSSVLLQLGTLDKPDSKLSIELTLAMPRPQTFKKVLEISACIGVTSIRVIQSKKVEKNYFKSKMLEPQHIEKHLRLGVEQGGKFRLPKVFIEKDYIRQSKRSDAKTRIILDSTGRLTLLEWSETLASEKSNQMIEIAVGPEGGWSVSEIARFEYLGFAVFKLGVTPLRVENAVCSALSFFEQLSSRNADQNFARMA